MRKMRETVRVKTRSFQTLITESIKSQQAQEELSTTTTAGNCLNPLRFEDYVTNFLKQVACNPRSSDETIVAFNSYERFLNDTVYKYQVV